MKKQVFGIFAVLTMLVALASISVHAQSQRDIVNIPFNFAVGEKTLPAGEYAVTPNRRDSQNIWRLEGDRNTVLFATVAVTSASTQEKTKLVFHKYNDQYFLSQVWIAGEDSGREIRATRVESQLARNGVQREEVTVTLGGLAHQ